MVKAIQSAAAAFILVFTSLAGSAQQHFWVQLSGKDTVGYVPQRHLSAQCLANRQLLGLPQRQFTDVPVSRQYLQEITRAGGHVYATSKWANAAAVEASAAQMARIKALPFVSQVTPMRQLVAASRHSMNCAASPMQPLRPALATWRLPLPSPDTSITLTLVQIDGAAFIYNKLNGTGVTIGIMDGGFRDAPEREALSPIFAQKRVKAYRDFFEPGMDSLTFFKGKEKKTNDTHGTSVWECIAGFNPGNGEMKGLATNATFMLARTENPAREQRIEEINYLRGLEWLDSMGVRLVNSSLGYSTKFDDPKENHSPADMDGKTTFVTRAAQKAVTEKGMIVINSGGNEGDDAKWTNIISAPADAPGVISVGATWPNGLRISYSGKGPEALGFTKPDVACFSLNGTSFSAPVIAGMVGCMLQARPDLTPALTQHLLHKASSLYPANNNYVGYGVPSADRLVKLLQDTSLNFNTYSQLKVKQDYYEIDPRTYSELKSVLVFHKKDGRNVVSQAEVMNNGKPIRIARAKGTYFSTIKANDQIIEIAWQGPAPKTKEDRKKGRKGDATDEEL